MGRKESGMKNYLFVGVASGPGKVAVSLCGKA